MRGVAWLGLCGWVRGAREGAAEGGCGVRKWVGCAAEEAGGGVLLLVVGD